LARKEGNLEHSISGSSGKCRTAASERSPYHASQRAAGIMDDPFGCRQSVIDVGNSEVCIFFLVDKKIYFPDFTKLYLMEILFG